MRELDERELHASVAGFIVWLTRKSVAPKLRHAYPPVVDEFLRWRHARLAAGQECNRDEFLDLLTQRDAPHLEREVASDAIGYYARFLADEPA